MPVRVVCSACSTVMQIADELYGKRIRCKSCGAVVAVEESSRGYTERQAPPPLASPKRRVVDDDDQGSPRRRRNESTSVSLMPLWIAGGGVFAVALIVVVIVLINSGSTPAPVANPNNVQPFVQNQQAVAQAPNAVEEKRNAPPLMKDPPAGETMKGEQIYQRLLQSTVWIVAEHKIVAAGNGRPFAQFEPPPFAQPGFQPKIPRGPIFPPNFPRGPQFGPPNMPGLNPGMPLLPNAGQSTTLINSSWSGNETLPGFGKLSFQFVTNVAVVMVDAKDTTRGSFVHTNNNVTISFAGGVIYNGVINGNSMSGSATNGKDNWTWTVTRAGGGGAAPIQAGPGGGIVATATGSGSVIDRKHRLIVTNVHVVGNNNNVTIYFPDFDDKGELIVHSAEYKRKTGRKGTVVLREERADLAFVQLDKLPEGIQPLSVVKSKAQPAQQVHSVGNPGATKGLWVYSPGKIRQVFPDQWDITDDLDGKTHRYNAVKITTDSAINPGDSGGPLVDDRCAMVGVAHGGSLVANNFSFFIEASEVRQLLEKYYKSVGDNFTL